MSFSREPAPPGWDPSSAARSPRAGSTRRASRDPRLTPEEWSVHNSVRSERAFCEELDYNPLFRWFLDMELIEPSFDATVFTKNR